MNGMPRVRHSSVCRSIASGSSAPMSTRSRPHRSWIGPELDHPGLGHRTRVEGRDLGHVVIGRADEAGGVLGLRDVHVVGDDPVPGQPAAVVGKVLARRADEIGRAPRAAIPKADVARDPSASDLQAVREEAHGDLVELLDDEGVGEAAPEGHQVVGRDGSGDGDLHASNLPAAQRVGGPGRGAGSGRRGSAEAVTAGAGTSGVGVVDREALLLDGVREVDGGAVEVRGAHPVDDDPDAREVRDEVTVEAALVEVELVDQAGAAAGLDPDAQAQVVATLLGEQGLDLLGGDVGEDDAVGSALRLGGWRRWSGAGRSWVHSSCWRWPRCGRSNGTTPQGGAVVPRTRSGYAAGIDEAG